MIVDAHCHAGAGEGFTGPWDTSAPLGDYLDRARAAGIQRTILLSVFAPDYAQANREIARIVRRDPDRLLAFAFVHAQRDRGRIEAMVDVAVRSYGFRGIKAHRHDARITAEVLEVARRYRLPVLYDVLGDTASVDLIAERFPTVALIIPHLGSFVDDWRAQRTLIDVLVRRRNVFADTAGVRRFDLLEEAIARAGAHKIIFGSDGPWFHPGVELAKVRALGLPRAEERLVLGGNIVRLMRAARPHGPSRRVAVAPAHTGRGPPASSSAPLEREFYGSAD